MARSRWGGFFRGRSFVQSGRTVRNSTPTVPASLDYRDASGIWNMKSSLQFPKVQRLQMTLQSSSFLGSAATVTTYSCPVPVAARAGDIAVAFFCVGNATATMSTPSGWTLGVSTSGTNPIVRIFYKQLVSGDLNTSISGTGAVAAAYSSGMMTFNGSGNSPATADTFSWTALGGTGTASGGALNITIGSSAGTGASVIAVGFASGNPTAQVNTITWTNQTASITCDATTGMSAGNISMAYSIFNSTTPLDLNVTTNDAGSQAGGGFYINCTLG